tara:strand:+ start:182 stop:457 length:276 start_codon:yes stop_codon:yes gene_type:complete
MRELKIKEHTTNVLNTKSFHNWLSKAKKGEKISYYRGYLVDPSIQRIGATNDTMRVEKFRKEVFNAHQSRLVTLVQKKHEDLDYEYIAIRR